MFSTFLFVFISLTFGQDRECTTSQPCSNRELFLTNAKKVICKDERTCFNTRMNINTGSDSNQFVSIGCHAFHACGEARITASNIEFASQSGVKELLCKADQSCYDAIWSLFCETTGGCNINCEGNEACAEVGNFFQEPAIVYNVNEFSCKGTKSCYKLAMDIFNELPNRVIKVNANGEEAFKDGTLFILGTSTTEVIPTTLNLHCIGRGACSLIEIGAFVTTANILCGPDACSGNFIDVPDSGILLINSAGGIKCDGFNSCNGLFVLNLLFEGAIEAGGSFKSVECFGESSCANALFVTQCDLITGCKVLCKGKNSCKNFLTGGIFGVTNLECEGFDACSNVANKAISIRDGFIVKCGVDSCTNGFFEFNIDPDGLAPALALDIRLNVARPTDEKSVTNIKGIECGGSNSCGKSTFKFIIFSNNGNVNVDTVSCSDATACHDSIFIFEVANTTNVEWEFDINKVFKCVPFCDSIKEIWVNGINIEPSSIVGLNVDVISDDITKPLQKNIMLISIGGGFLFLFLFGVILTMIYKYKYDKSNNEVASQNDVVNDKTKSKDNESKKDVTPIVTQIDFDDGTKTTI